MGPLKDLLQLKRREGGLTAEKIELATGVPARYVQYLESGEYYRLPPDAYVFGYLVKLAELYDLNARDLWGLYQTEKGETVRSGASDRFPGSDDREAKKARVGFKVPLFAVAVVALFAYVIWQGYVLMSPPEIRITSPSLDTTARDPRITLEGFVTSRSSLFINNEPVVMGSGGTFSREFSLQAGLNVFTLRAEHLLGKSTVETRRVVYEPPVASVLEAANAAAGNISQEQ